MYFYMTTIQVKMLFNDFYFIALHSSLLVDEKSCTFSNGELVTVGIAELEVWCSHATEAVLMLIDNSLVHCSILLLSR